MNVVKIFKLIATAGVAALLCACSGITNLSPAKMPRNPSDIYTLTMSGHINDGSIVKNSVKGYVVIDEQMCEMTQVSDRDGERTFEYEYKMPRTRTEAKYYYVLTYVTDTGAGGKVERKIVSPMVYDLKTQSRYVTNMEFSRGQIGTVVPVTGRGFNSQDKVKIGDVYADIDSVTRNVLKFIVPPLKSGVTYDVKLENEEGISWIGTFKVDTSELSVSPSSIELTSGDVINLVFFTGFKAPESGYPIEVTTNIPSSVIMPEVVVKAGEDRVVVPIKGGSEGVGCLYINALGYKEKVIPVTVKMTDFAATSGIEKIQKKVEQK